MEKSKLRRILINVKSHDVSVYRDVTAWVGVERKGMESSFNSAVLEVPGCYWGLAGA